ncbi:STAS domain-containing protein [Streptodolium elevatio]
MPSHQPVHVPDCDPLYLGIHRCDTGMGALFVIQGEIDPDTAPQLRGALQRCLRDGHRHIDVDLSRVTFCDSFGLHVFLDVSRGAAEVGGHLRLHRPNPIVARLLTLTGTGALLLGLPARPPPVPVSVTAAPRQAAHFPTNAPSDGPTNGCGNPTANRVPVGRAGSAAAALFPARWGQWGSGRRG